MTSLPRCLAADPQHWEKGMDKDALQQAERESFIEWRRTLAELQELEDVLMTPFERNIEFWRQLWRVIERSVRAALSVPPHHTSTICGLFSNLT